jgi:hypothetical protein
MQDGPTISNLPEGHNLTTASVVINMPAPVVTPGSPLVKVLIKYPPDWKKDKFFKDGDIVEVSPESAATFVEKGIATMHDEANKAPVVEEHAALESTGEATQEEQAEVVNEEQPENEGKKPKKGK